MANLVISSDFNLNNPSDFFGSNPVRTDLTSTGFHVYDAGTGNHVYITGQNFAYNGNKPISGTMTGLVCITGNGQETLFNMSGVYVDVVTNNSIDFTSFGQEVNYWLGANPTITTVPGGMSGSQTIQAPTGTNQVFGYTGNNTVVYTAPSNKFTISVNSVLDASNGNGTVTVYQGDPLAPTTANTERAVQTTQFGDGVSIQTSWLTKASLLHTTNAPEFSVLSELYLAYFNRAPDSLGLDYWASNAYDYIRGGTADVNANKLIANNFALSPESKAIYGTINQSSSVAELQNFVTKVYQNVLNRGPDQTGLDYWVNNLKTGASSPGSFIVDVVYAVNSQSGTTDKVYLSNKATAGEHFAVDVGLTNVQQGQNVMAVYNATYASSGAAAALNAANAQTNTYASSASLTTTPELIIHLIGF